MKALVVDAYDSFVYIIYQYLLRLGVEARVVRHDRMDTQADIERFSPDFLLLGPGPGHPANVCYVELIRQYGGRIPIMGVCLGHQAIGLAFGGQIDRASHIMHGKCSQIQHDGQGCFRHAPSPFKATRYHSLIVRKEGLPECLRITASARDDGYIMGLRHNELPIESVQFHPESVFTESGIALFENFISGHVKSRTVAGK